MVRHYLALFLGWLAAERSVKSVLVFFGERERDGGRGREGGRGMEGEGGKVRARQRVFRETGEFIRESERQTDRERERRETQTKGERSRDNLQLSKLICLHKNN